MEEAILPALLKYGLGVAVLAWVAYSQSKKLAALDVKADTAAARCDAERRELSAEIAKVRDAHAKDQREVLIAATAALADVAKTNRALVEIHERRDGSGVHRAKID